MAKESWRQQHLNISDHWSAPLTLKSLSALEYYWTVMTVRFFVPSNLTFPHSASVVGYGSDDYGWDFWTIKNSWGTQWGEEGFIRLYRGLGHCGVGSYISQPVCRT